jgi:hypothetical protein
MSIELIVIYFHSFEIFNIQIGEMEPDFIIIKSNYFQNAQKGQRFLNDFEALVRKKYLTQVLYFYKFISNKKCVFRK